MHNLPGLIAFSFTFIPSGSPRFIYARHIQSSEPYRAHPHRQLKDDHPNAFNITNSRDVSNSLQTDSNKHSCSRRSLLKSMALLANTGLLLAVTGPRNASAFCGEEVPFWAHYLKWDEGYFSVNGRQVAFRYVGKEKDEKKNKVFPIVFIGDVGFSHSYLEPFEALAESNRRVFFFDSLGSGISDKLSISSSPSELWNLGVEEIEQLRSFFKLTRFHLVSHGFGATIALQYAQKNPDHIASLVLESPTVGYTLFSTKRDVTSEFSKSKMERPICFNESLDTLNENLLAALPKNPNTALNVSLDQPINSPILLVNVPSTSNIGTILTERIAPFQEEASTGDNDFYPHLDQSKSTILEKLTSFFDNIDKVQKKN